MRSAEEVIAMLRDDDDRGSGAAAAAGHNRVHVLHGIFGDYIRMPAEYACTADNRSLLLEFLPALAAAGVLTRDSSVFLPNVERILEALEREKNSRAPREGKELWGFRSITHALVPRHDYPLWLAMNEIAIEPSGGGGGSGGGGSGNHLLGLHHADQIKELHPALPFIRLRST
jgi:hypothetical protein